jgi:hypothetical protein
MEEKEAIRKAKAVLCARKWRAENPERAKETQRKAKKAYRARLKARHAMERERLAGEKFGAEYLSLSEDDRKRFRKRYYSSLPENKARRREKYQRNRDKLLQASKEWIKRNRKSISAKALARYHADPAHNIRTRFMTRMRESLRVKKPHGSHWFDLLGYTFDALKRHLERKFLPGMSWDNMGEWHIDHIIPVTAFNFTSVDDADFKRCFALTNLRPMWAEDNMRKSASLEKPFQPSLAMGF